MININIIKVYNNGSRRPCDYGRKVKTNNKCKYQGNLELHTHSRKLLCRTESPGRWWLGV